MSITIDEALADQSLLGAALGDIETWGTWRAVLKAAYGLTLAVSEAEAFETLAGGRQPPVERVAELWCVIGRRGGKSRMAAAVAVYEAVFRDHTQRLAPGEVGFVLLLSPSKSQARAVKDYIEGFFRSSPILTGLIQDVTAEEIRLTNGIVIAVHTNSYRTVRGKTLVACIFEEISFWRSDESASPDVEVLRAVLPALATTNGLLVAISSPYRRVGLLHERHRAFFGKDGDVLVVQAPTTALNPTISRSVIDRAMASDPEAAKAEWLGAFRSDLSSLLDDAAIDAAIDCDRPLELPPRSDRTYFAFADPSGGRADAFTLAIAHMEGDRIVVDVLRGKNAPFDPNVVAAEYAALAREYGCRSIVGDAYSGEYNVSAFRAAGMVYERCPTPKSGLYLESVAVFNRHAISIPDHPQLIRELRLLERRVAPSGKDRVDHAQGQTDDYANAVVGVMSLAIIPVRTARSVRVSFGR